MLIRNKKLQNTHAALPIVAQAWGQKMGVKVVVGGNTAMTDGKTIVVPNVNESFGSLEPIWGYLLHEAQHVKDTDFSVERRGEFFSSLVNIFEDVRIERDAINEYPGAKSMLDACATYMVDQNHYSMVAADEPPARIVGAFCLYYGQLMGVGQTFLQEYLDSAESALRASMPDLELPLKDLIDESIQRMQSTQDAADYSRKVLELMQDLLEDEQQNQQQSQQQSQQQDAEQGEDGEGQSGEGDSQGSQDQSEGEESESQGGGGEGEGDSSSDETGDQNGESGNGEANADAESSDAQGDADSQNQDGDGQQQSDGGNADDNADKGQSQDSSNDASEQSDDQGGDTEGGQSSDGQQDESKQDGGTKEQAKPGGKNAGGEQAKALEQALNANQQEVLEDARDALKRDLFDQNDWSKPLPAQVLGAHQSPLLGAGRFKSAMAASGGLRRQFSGLLQSEQHTADRRARTGRLGNNLSRVIQGDTKVFVRRGQRIETGAAVHILVDRSGSMASQAENGQSWLDIAAEAAATMFAAVETQPNTGCGLSFFDCAVFKAVPQGQRLAAHKSGLGVAPEGSTATGEAILAVLGDLLMAKQERKLLFVVTDGAPNCPVRLKESIRIAESMGVEIHGVGICLPEVEKHFASSIVINNVMDLRKELLTLARKSL